MTIRGDKPFLLLMAIVTFAFLWVVAPFAGPVLWAIVAAMLFRRPYEALCRQLNGRENLATSLTLMAIVALFVVPAMLLGAALVGEASDILLRIRSGAIDPMAILARFRQALPPWMVEPLGIEKLTDVGQLQALASEHLSSGLQTVVGRAINIGQGAFAFFLGIAVMLYLAFFFLRDGRRIAAHVEQIIPLDPRHKRPLLDRFISVVHATIKGSLVVAAVQGAIGGVVFWAIGVHAPLLWGVAMAFMSLLPAIGTGLIWVPVAIYLLVTGAVWQGAVLVFCGLFVIGLVDNILRPVLVGRDTRMPDYMVFLSTVGGIEVFGINGFILGPMIAGLFMACWELFATEQQGETLTPAAPPPTP
jgi:predicted PurR-regulated permease PerM